MEVKLHELGFSLSPCFDHIYVCFHGSCEHLDVIFHFDFVLLFLISLNTVCITCFYKLLVMKVALSEVLIHYEVFDG